MTARLKIESDPHTERRLSRENRALRTALRRLTEANLLFLDAVDRTFMTDPSMPKDLGRKLAKLCNALDTTNDSTRYSALGVDFRTDDKAQVIKRLKTQNATATHHPIVPER